MKYMISTVSDSKVYHKDGCPYIKKISKGHGRWVNVNSPLYKNYKPCKYCGGIQGWARIFHKRPDHESEEARMDCWYDDEKGFLFIRTWIGFWKLYWKDNLQEFVLFHKNWFEPEMSKKKLMRGPFHKQWDMQSSKNFDNLVHYIYGHDRNKEIAADDYRKLPQNTKKQKQHYKHHKKMAEKAKAKRLDELFKEIESSRK